jgi:hypothetical protein
MIIEVYCIFYFSLSRLSDGLLKAIDNAYGFSQSGNSEIRFRWHTLCLKCEVNWLADHNFINVVKQSQTLYNLGLFLM